MSKKELIWVSEGLAEKFNQLETTQEQEKLVMEVIETKKIDIKYECEILDDNILSFKASCLKHRNAMKEHYDSENEKLEEIVSGYIGKRDDMTKAFEGVLTKAEEVEKKISKVRDQFERLNIYSAERLIQFAQQISNMDQASKDILLFLSKNYTREE